MTCHSRAAGFVLGLTEMQLNKVHDYCGVLDNQLRTLKHIGVFTGTLPKPSTNTMVDPYDSRRGLEARARIVGFPGRVSRWSGTDTSIPWRKCPTDGTKIGRRVSPA